MPKIQYGIETSLQVSKPRWRSGRWGMVTNDAARTQAGVPTRVALIQAGCQLSCLFSPEHGLSAQGADGEAQSHQQDRISGLPVYSLYGPQFQPALDSLQELDGILFDLPDVGLRFYTYIWTLSYIMEACQATGKTLLVFDRPNPLSGQMELAEGPYLDEEHLSSFIGRWRMPVRHSLTIGELARYWQHSRKMTSLDLHIFPCKGWRRSQYLTDVVESFVPPSPAINHPATLLTYPALCFIEGVNLSEGRGTPYPFQQVGAPWIESRLLADRLQQRAFAGASFTPCTFRPESGRYVGKICQGVRLEIHNRSSYRPIQTGIGLLAILQLLYPEKLQWAPYPTHANPSGAQHLDLLLGTPDLRQLIATNPQQILDQLPSLTKVPDWPEMVTPFLLYK